jgi:hypothetical protein
MVTQAEKLEALIEKVGWFKGADAWRVEEINGRLSVVTETEWYTDVDYGLDEHMYSWQEIIFSHDFARALFGDKEIQVDHLDDQYRSVYYWRTEGFDNAWFEGPAWIFHLQQAVISKSPIDYAYATLHKDNGTKIEH